MSILRRAGHLSRRFVTSLWPAPPRTADDAWVRSVLSPEEYALWARLPNHDRRHSIGVARRVDATLAGTPEADDPRWTTAALLHDVGKLDADLGVFGRVGATLAGAIAGRERTARWTTRSGYVRRVGLYLQHPERGADLVRAAGGADAVARWAGAHHDRGAWDATGIPATVLVALHEADDD